MKAKPKICIIVATPLTIHFFFRNHIIKMSEWADVTLMFNSELNPNINLDDLPSRNIHVNIMRNISLMRDVVGLFALWLQFRQQQFDMVISLVPKAGLLGMTTAWAGGVPARLHIFQGEVWATATGLMRHILKTADAVTAFFATDLMAVSASERAFLETQIGTASGRVRVLGFGSICGVDIKRFKFDRDTRKLQRNALNIPEDAVVALFLGRLTRDKGVFSLVEAFGAIASEFSNFYLIIAGPDEDNIAQDLVVSAGDLARDRLIMFGYSERPWALNCAADFLCLLSYREGFGMVAIEAAACGIPALGNKIHGLEDAIIDNETGILVSVDDFSGAVSALRTLIVDADFRANLGDAARKRVVAQFGQEDVVNAYDAAFKKIIALRLEQA